MAFTCEPCHKKPIVTLCFAGITSFGRCENCGIHDECADCRCPTLIATGCGHVGIHTVEQALAHLRERCGEDGIMCEQDECHICGNTCKHGKLPFEDCFACDNGTDIEYGPESYGLDNGDEPMCCGGTW